MVALPCRQDSLIGFGRPADRNYSNWLVAKQGKSGSASAQARRIGERDFAMRKKGDMI
jgi:hypothetical protein